MQTNFFSIDDAIKKFILIGLPNGTKNEKKVLKNNVIGKVWNYCLQFRISNDVDVEKMILKN